MLQEIEKLQNEIKFQELELDQKKAKLKFLQDQFAVEQGIMQTGLKVGDIVTTYDGFVESELREIKMTKIGVCGTIFLKNKRKAKYLLCNLKKKV